MNTPGSFNCFCSPPLVLDSTRRRCVSLNTTEGARPPPDLLNISESESTEPQQIL